MGTLLNILKLLPAIMTAVKALEEQVDLPGKGSDKLSLIIGIVQDLAGDISDLIPAVTKVVARVVTFFKATGVFK